MKHRSFGCLSINECFDGVGFLLNGNMLVGKIR